MVITDRNLRFLCKEILKNVPFVTSIILHGSRAVECPCAKERDYDVFVVLRTPLSPFFLKSIKRMEESFRKKKIKIDLSLMPVFRLKYGFEDLSVYNVRATGVTIWGRDYLNEFPVGDARRSIGRSWLQYCVYVMRRLMWCFNPYTLNFNVEATVEALNVCCRLVALLLTGTYFTNTDAMLRKLRSIKGSSQLPIGDGAFRLLEEVTESSELEPSALFMAVKNEVLEIFRLLIERSYSINTSDSKTLSIEYLKAARSRSLIENVLYLFSLYVFRREVFLNANIFGSSIFDRINMATYWLLNSIRSDCTIDMDSIMEAYKLLDGWVKLRFHVDARKLWCEVRNVINEYYHYARASFQFTLCLYTALSSIFKSTALKG
ncbi:nucleotidyltransferase domain-containing protein [Candidatus Bathyarchaeota archaeon]|nr:MAG: nucleotidyltransferase domain-containing protein [Candidatus Bathyarchaeota archaeon]